MLSNFFSVNNGVRQGGTLSPLLFNVYIDDLSLSLLKLPVGCCCGKTAVNHLMYVDDTVLLAPSAKGLLAPSAKGLQRILDASYTSGCDNDILFSSQKSQVMFFDTMKSGHVADIMLGEMTLNVTKSYKYLGQIIINV